MLFRELLQEASAHLCAYLEHHWAYNDNAFQCSFFSVLLMVLAVPVWLVFRFSFDFGFWADLGLGITFLVMALNLWVVRYQQEEEFLLEPLLSRIWQHYKRCFKDYWLRNHFMVVFTTFYLLGMFAVFAFNLHSWLQGIAPQHSFSTIIVTIAAGIYLFVFYPLTDNYNQEGNKNHSH